MSKADQIEFDMIPSFLGAPIGDLEDLIPGQVAIAGYFCDNLERPAAGQRYLARQLRYASQAENAPANITDLGDVNVFPLEPDKHVSAVVLQCETVLKTGARFILAGGDSSGLKALSIAARTVLGADIPVVSVASDQTSNQIKTQPIILSVDLQKLAGSWMSQPRRISGLSPADIITQIDATQGRIIAAAVFGLAPALDCRGTMETRAALMILRAVATRLNAEAG
jgi:arginase family enzyme